MKSIIFLLAMMVTPFFMDAQPKTERSEDIEKEPVVKINNTGEIITRKQLDKINPKTIKSIDVFPDTVFITLNDKIKACNHEDKKK